MAKQRRGNDRPQGEVWLFDADGSDLGFLTAEQALERARERNLDLVRLDQLSSPPRFGLCDAAKHDVEAARVARIARGGEAKEIRVRVGTGAADVETRRRNAETLLAAGHRVKLRVELDPGRRGDPAPARSILDALIKALATAGRPEAKPQSEKGAVAVVLAPLADKL
jgi:translation initiation factor IF-3